eukprot:m.192292 g.192292  ORF g.192292 m.192292 type:complete len:364 (+) comp18265_c1_seq1:228-1319(+)
MHQSTTNNMKYNYLGNTGVKVSAICLGTMTFGERGDGSPGQLSEAASHELLDKFVELGGNFIDTADVYSGGKSEEYIGTWLEKQDRDSLVLATKLRFPTSKTDVNAVGLSRKHIIAGVDASLKRLKTPYIDLLQTHCWDEGTPIEETLGALASLVQQGKVLYVGVSNVTGWQLQKIVDTAKSLNLPIASLQSQYNLLCRWTEWELLPVCEREGVAMLPWSPLKGGWLSGKFHRGMAEAPEGSRVAWAEQNAIKLQSAPGFAKYAKDDKIWDLTDALAEVAKETGKSVAQVSLKWLLQQAAVPSVVIGAKKISQLEDNCGAGGEWELSAAQLQKLNDVSALDIPYPYEMVWRCQGARKRSFDTL